MFLHGIPFALLFSQLVATPSNSSAPKTPLLVDERYPDAYALALSIEQLEEAWRPRWDWSERRYVDDDLLHVEMSLTLVRTQDDATVGGLYDIHDYRRPCGVLSMHGRILACSKNH